MLVKVEANSQLVSELGPAQPQLVRYFSWMWWGLWSRSRKSKWLDIRKCGPKHTSFSISINSKFCPYCQTPDIDQDLSLGVDFVFPLEQQEEEEEDEPPTKIYRKDVKHKDEIRHISLTHKNKIKWQLSSQHLSKQKKFLVPKKFLVQKTFGP